ncbi:fluoride efflux transporter CrcB [Flavimaricola marinus]|uniref:Fluoride-specific ion channel FluC n=1 Tax=Flavimaricola marinus TaxID=1819565 RepID=A0A238LAE8_9RHOB|nr:fluoride efflux transporter CrcB [Flavimaricola marinus]SMY06395.1 Putative fluoride ion transporter CrcB [Flavimaricola marinus]
MILAFLQVALGGAVGSALRFGVGLLVLRAATPGFPLAILTVNILGSFAMGLCVVWLAQRGLTAWQPLVMTGLLGGFTTFSAFSLETFTLFERGQIGAAALYVALSIILSVGALAAGVILARGLWA